jgi:trk system potassium uptake protein TrkH
MLLPLITALICHESPVPFAVPLAATALLGLGLSRVRASRTVYTAREGFVTVGLAWMLISLLAAIPFVMSGDIPNYLDALFETVSGLSTTGATILSDVEGLQHGVQFWRLFCHWIGGMGILVFIMAVLPLAGDHSMHIMRAEVPGPVVGKIVPKARQTARILYVIYLVLTVVETVMLLFGGMSFFDALLHSFATAGTGGFSTRALSVGYYHSAYIEIVIATFMLLFGTNLSLYFLILIGSWREAAKNEELRWYLGIVLFAVVTIALNIGRQAGSFGEALRSAYFQVSSIITTTGFSTADFTQWPAYSQAVLVLLMFVGGCAGSTAGALKVSRVAILCKNAAAELGRMLRPRSVVHVRLEGKVVQPGTLKAVEGFFFSYVLLLLLGTLGLSLDGFDFTTNFTATLACISNVGPGLSLVGPMGNFDIFSPLSKLVLIFEMLLGRLELYPVLLLFVPATWRAK